jgi:hypothetical protein
VQGIRLSLSEKQMITFLQDGADGEYINVFELKDERTLQELGLAKPFLGRIISTNDDVPEVPAEFTPILWIAPFSASDRAHVRYAGWVHLIPSAPY